MSIITHENWRIDKNMSFNKNKSIRIPSLVGKNEEILKDTLVGFFPFL